MNRKNKKIKIGIIGCGKITRASHIPAFQKISGKTEITGLYDLNPETAQKTKKDFSLDAEIHPSAKALIESGIDAVLINTPNKSHYPLSMQALGAGVHVLVEKPMALNLGQADNMLRKAKNHKLVLQVNQSLRFNALYAGAADLVHKGAVGKVIHVRCLRTSSKSPDKGWSPGASWFVQKSFGGGLIMDIAVHMADYLGWVCGRAKSLYAVNSIRVKKNDVPDNVTAVIDFESGATGVLELSWTIPAGGSAFELYGEKGTIKIEPKNELLFTSAAGKTKIITPLKRKSSQEWFIDAINKKTGNPSPGEAGRHALAYCMAIEKSGRIGRPVAPELK